MTRLFTAPTTRRPLAPALTAPPVAPHAVPGPDESPVGPDVEDVGPGEIIESAWGISVAEDLAEIHAALAAGGGGGGLTTEQVRDLVASFVRAGANMTIAHDDAGDTLTFTAAGGGGGITTEDAVDAVAASLVGGANVTITYNDAANTITISATGGSGGGLDVESAIDAVAAALVAGNNVDITYNDAANTITIDVEVLTTADITGLDTALTGKADAAATTTALAGKQPLDSDLTTIAALAPANDTVVQRKSGVWVASTPATVKTDLALTKSDVGLANVDNTSDANKPVSTAQATADALKADKATTVPVTAPITGGGTLGTPTAIGISDFTTTTRGAVPNPTASTGRFLKDDGTWAMPPSSGASGVFPFMYSATTTEPPTGSQLRGNVSPLTGATRLWVMETTTDGLNVAVGLGRIRAGWQVYVQDFADSTKFAIFNVTADPTDKGTYWELTVALASSAGTIGAGKVAFQSLSTAQAGTLFSTTSTAPGLTPGSNNAAATLFLNAKGNWVAPAPPVGGARLTQIYTVPGPLAPGTGTTEFVVTLPGRVVNVWTSVTNVFTGSSLIVDANVNGVTVFPTQSARPTILAGERRDTTGTPTAGTFIAGDRITVDIDQTGTHAAADQVTVGVEYTYD